jgi:thioredoxin-dependent peroxiredoxin
MEEHGKSRSNHPEGKSLTLIGPELKAGDAAPDFHTVDNGLKPVTLKDTGKGRCASSA